MLGTASLTYLGLSLDRAGELAAALVRNGVLSHEPDVRPEGLSDARTLRDALLRCFAARIDGSPLPARDVETLNSFSADEPPMLQLAVAGTMMCVATDPVRAALSAIARDGIELLALRGADLRRCDGCGAPYLDSSRGSRRRWCAMARCGNRAKVTEYRARRQR